MTFLLLLLACNKGSSAFATEELILHATAFSAGEGATSLWTELAAPLVAGGYVRLDGNDELVVEADGEAVELTEETNVTRTSYVATLGEVSEIVIKLKRGDATTEGTVLPVPDAFELLHPDPYTEEWAVGDDVPIQWDNVTSDEMNVAIGGTCLAETWTGAGVPGDGVVVPATEIVFATETDGCTLDVGVDRVATATADPDLRGVEATAVQERVVEVLAVSGAE